MATTKLAVYNKALFHLGERKLASLTENREPRRALDEWYDVDAFLEAGLWRFARRTTKLTYSPSIEPSFGYRRAFTQPDDFIRTAMLSADEYFNVPFEAYAVEAGFWFADVDEIYLSYISNDASYGGDLSMWSSAFEDWVAAWLASKIAMRVTGDEKKSNYCVALEDKLLKIARSRDSIEEPTKMPPHGTWVSSRQGRWGTRRDGGTRGQLIG